MNCCPDCHEYGTYCTCEEKFQANMDELWEHNIDTRPPFTEDYDEWEEWYLWSHRVSEPTEEELQQRLRDEIEMLIELGFE